MIDPVKAAYESVYEPDRVPRPVDSYPIAALVTDPMEILFQKTRLMQR